jgi:hypothetical protein
MKKILLLITVLILFYSISFTQQIGPGAPTIPTDLDVDGRISSGTLIVTSANDTDPIDVSGVNVLLANSTGGDVNIVGFSGGVDGQIINIVRIAWASNTVTVSNGASAGQDIFLNKLANETLGVGVPGGWTLVCNGTSWYEANHEFITPITSTAVPKLLTAPEMRGGTIVVTAATEVELPDMCDSASGVSVTVVASAGHVVEIAVVAAEDTINYQGLALGADDELDSGGTAFESVTLKCLATNNWYAIATLGAWVDGGPADD